MKTKATILLSLAAFILATGCATPPAPGTVKMFAQMTASTGGVLLLQRRPQAAPAIAKAKKGLEDLTLLETGTSEDIQRVLNQAFGDEPGTAILVGNLTAFVTWLQGRIELGNRDPWTGYVRPAAEGLAAGFGQALTTTQVKP